MRTKGYTLIILILLAVLAAFSSCTPQQRLARLLKKYPELVKKDTIFQKDTIRIAGDKADTLFLQSSSKDTVIVEKGRLLIKYYYSKDTVFLQGQCKDSLVIREIPVYVTEVKEVSTGVEFEWWWIAIIFGLFIIFILLIRKA